MKKTISAFVVLSVLTVAANAWAFNRNISGAWQEPDGTRWIIAQAGNSCSFSTSIRTEATGLISFNFSGYISGNGGDDDFSYSGLMEPKNVRAKGKSCRLTGSMNASGDVAGEYGGRVIHMDACSVSITITCGDKSDTTNGSCVGTWS